MPDITPFDPNEYLLIPEDSDSNDPGIIPVSYIQTTAASIGDLPDDPEHVNETNNFFIDPLTDGNNISTINLVDGIDISSVSEMSLFISGDSTVSEGSNLVLEAVVTITGALADPAFTTYQWQKLESTGGDWTDIPGATESTYEISSVTFADDHNDSYRVTATNIDAENSPQTAEITLNVRRIITITTQPVGVSIIETQTATFNVNASITSGVISYQWQKRDFESSVFIDIAGANSTSYTTPPAVFPDDVQDTYRCVLTNTNADTVISDEVILDVLGADIRVTPAVGGNNFWRFSDLGSLILDPADSTSYEIFCITSDKTIKVDMWGEGSCSSEGGYSQGFVPFAANQLYTVKLNYGGGTGGDNGGGLAGLFSTTTINQSNALLIAGGAGGGGLTSSGCTYSGGTGGGLTGGDAFDISSGTTSPTYTAASQNTYPSQPYGWYTRSGGIESDPYSGVRQLVIRWNGTTVYDGAGVGSGPVVVDGYSYYPSTYRPSSLYGWSSDFNNAFDVYRTTPNLEGGVGGSQTSGGAGAVSSAGSGSSGTALQGGNGGTGTYSGGGGGGGYFGGGGGVGYDTSSGGGGGSGFVAATVSGVTSGFVSTVSGVTRGTAGEINSNSRVVFNFGVITITTQPTVNASYVLNETATMSVTASVSFGTLNYQWQKRESGSADWNDISGATSSSYTTPSLSEANDNGDSYRCVLSSLAAATVITNVVTLTVFDYDLTITPSVGGVSNWAFAVNGNLILDPNNSTSYSITFLNNISKVVKMWGQGGVGGGTGGYSTGTVNFTTGVTYEIRLNAGGANAGPGNGSGAWANYRGGGYAGIFRNSVTQGNAVMIAGGGGGGFPSIGGSASGTGGGGGGNSGGSGQNSPDTQRGSTAGGGGSQSGGGGAGSSPGGGSAGGSALAGGVGGRGAGSFPNYSGGGGGGGGYFGGGGGGGGNDDGQGSRGASGGGGGSGRINGTYVTGGSTSGFTDSGDADRGGAGNSGANSRIVIKA